MLEIPRGAPDRRCARRGRGVAEGWARGASQATCPPPGKKGVEVPGRVWPWMAGGRVDGFFPGAPARLTAQVVCGQAKSAQRSRPVRHDPGCGVRRGGQRRGRTLGGCTASMRAGDLALHFAWDGRCTANFDGTLLTLRGAERPAFSSLTAWMHGAVRLADGSHENEPSLPGCALNGFGMGSRPNASGATPASGRGILCRAALARISVSSSRNRAGSSGLCSLLWCSVIACNPAVSGGIGLWLHHSPGEAVRQRQKINF